MSKLTKIKLKTILVLSLMTALSPITLSIFIANYVLATHKQNVLPSAKASTLHRIIELEIRPNARGYNNIGLGEYDLEREVGNAECELSK